MKKEQTKEKKKAKEAQKEKENKEEVEASGGCVRAQWKEQGRQSPAEEKWNINFSRGGRQHRTFSRLGPGTSSFGRWGSHQGNINSATSSFLNTTNTRQATNFDARLFLFSNRK